MEKLQVIEKNGERVLLTSQLAESYGTTAKVISNNFIRNQEIKKDIQKVNTSIVLLVMSLRSLEQILILRNCQAISTNSIFGQKKEHYSTQKV